jgi:putative transposase
MDLYSRAIVGWSMNRRMTQHLVCDALTMALLRRQFPIGTIVHCDRGSQYCSKRYQQLLSNNALRCSMGRRATCYDNAVTQSFFHSLKVELVHRQRYTTRRMAQTSIFEYIETYYNRQRNTLPSAIGFRCCSTTLLNRLSGFMAEDHAYTMRAIVARASNGLDQFS